MARPHSGTYQAPKETQADKKLFEQICSEIKSIQSKLTTNPNLAFLDVNGYSMKIVSLRKKARALNQKFRVRRDVP